MKNLKPIVIVIFLVGVCLRLAMLSTPYLQDERKNVLVAQTISFDPANLNLPMESKYVTHPLLNVYLTKIGVLLFGDNKFGVRILHLLCGVLTMLVVYRLVRPVGEDAAILAMFLIAFNQFHIHASIRAENTSMLIFFTALSMLLFLKAVLHKKSKHMILLGLVLGLAFMIKGVSLLLILGFGLFLISTPAQRIWFERKATWIAVALFVLTISPWIMWVSAFGSSQLIFDERMYSLSSVLPNRTAFSFYLIEPLAWIKKIDYRLYNSWEYGVMDGVTGIGLLCLIGWSVCETKR